MGFLLHNVSDVAAVRPYLRRKHRGEVTFSAPASGSEIGEVPAGGRGCDLTDAFKRAWFIHLIIIFF